MVAAMQPDSEPDLENPEVPAMVYLYSERKFTIMFRKMLWAAALPILFITATAFKKNELGKWKEKQLMPPEALLAQIRQGDTANLVLLNTGPVEDIQGAITIGAVEDAKNLARLKEYLKTVPTDKQVVIYCGCCPLSVCPNLMPAYQALKDMRFKNYKVLRLTHDLQEDWIDKGYPTQP